MSDVVRKANDQQTRLPAYSVTRLYTVRNDHLAKPAVLQVFWTYQPGAGKKFRIVKSDGMRGLTRRSVIKLLKEDVKNSIAGRNPSSISPENYAFELAGIQNEEIRIRLLPVRATKYLLNGYASVDRERKALTQVEGKTAKRISFWVGEADVVQQFAIFDGFWLPSRTMSAASIRLVGRTELVIESSNYRWEGGK